MPYKLLFNAPLSGERAVTLPSPLLLSSLAAGASCRIEVDFDLNAVGVDHALLFNVSDYSFLRIMPSGIIRAGYLIQSGFNDEVQSSAQSLVVGQKYTLSFDLSQTRQIAELRLNGALIGSASNRWGTFRVKDAGLWPGSSALNGHIYEIRQYQNGALIGKQSAENVSSGTVLPDVVGSNNMNQIGSWPSNNSEWVFYSSGATAYTDTLLAGSYSHSGSLLSSAVGYSSALQAGSFAHNGIQLSSSVARRSTLLAGSYTHSGSALGSAVGYSSALQGGAFSYSGSELQSTISNGAQNYSDTLLGGSFTHSGSALQSAIARNSTLLAGSYSHSGSSLSASLAFYSTLNGGAYSHFGSMLQSTISGQVTVSIEGYTITFAADDVSGAFAADMVGGSYQSDYIEAIKWLI